MLERVWLLKNVRSLAARCAVGLYGLGEHPFQRWGGLRGGVFQQLLDAGFTPQLAAALREVPLARAGHHERLVEAGWYRLGTAFSDGTYRLVIVQRPEARVERLTEREFGVAELAARGWRSQRVGVALSIAPATVRGAIDRCVLKLELASSVQLPLLWSTLGVAGRCFIGASGSRYSMFETPLAPLLSPLTNAERQLVERLLQGDSQRAMAEHRGVSLRTVANQMSRLFEKLDVSSRNELVARLLELERQR